MVTGPPAPIASTPRRSPREARRPAALKHAGLEIAREVKVGTPYSMQGRDLKAGSPSGINAQTNGTPSTSSEGPPSGPLEKRPVDITSPTVSRGYRKQRDWHDIMERMSAENVESRFEMHTQITRLRESLARERLEKNEVVIESASVRTSLEERLVESAEEVERLRGEALGARGRDLEWKRENVLHEVAHRAERERLEAAFGRVREEKAVDESIMRSHLSDVQAQLAAERKLVQDESQSAAKAWASTTELFQAMEDDLIRAHGQLAEARLGEASMETSVASRQQGLEAELNQALREKRQTDENWKLRFEQLEVQAAALDARSSRASADAARARVEAEALNDQLTEYEDEAKKQAIALRGAAEVAKSEARQTALLAAARQAATLSEARQAIAIAESEAQGAAGHAEEVAVARREELDGAFSRQRRALARAEATASAEQRELSAHLEAAQREIAEARRGTTSAELGAAAQQKYLEDHLELSQAQGREAVSRVTRVESQEAAKSWARIADLEKAERAARLTAQAEAAAHSHLEARHACALASDNSARKASEQMEVASAAKCQSLSADVARLQAALADAERRSALSSVEAGARQESTEVALQVARTAAACAEIAASGQIELLETMLTTAQSELAAISAARQAARAARPRHSRNGRRSPRHADPEGQQPTPFRVF